MGRRSSCRTAHRPRFIATLDRYFSRESLELEPASVFALGPDGTIAYVNRAWDRFAADSHCRRVRQADEIARWDWVPEWVERQPAETSHGICPACFNYYYPMTRE